MSTQAAERLEYLRTRITERDVVVEDVWDYLALNHAPHAGMQNQNLADFIKEQDLVSFWWLHDWWAPVQDKPATLPVPTIAQFCWNIAYAPGAEPITFDAALQQFYHRARAYCVANDMDPNNPGETAEERRKRRNRERMAAVRAHRRVPDKVVEHDEALAAQVRGLEQECEALKAEADRQDSYLKEQTKEHQRLMMESSAKRKEVAADFKARIENLRNEIRNLTTKE